LTTGWASQQRRVGDDTILITQVPGNVSKRLRDLSQECVHHINHKFRSFGWFRQPDVISFAVYGQTPPGNGEEPMRRAKLTYSRKFVYSCYDTAAGVGVASATNADIGQKAKGLHWAWWPGFAVVACVACLGLMYGCKQGLKAVAMSQLKPSKASLGIRTNQVAAPVQVVTNRLLQVGGHLRATNSVIGIAAGNVAPVVPRGPELGISALTRGTAGNFATMTDGSIRKFNEVVDLGEGFAADGRFYPARQPDLESGRRGVYVERAPIGHAPAPKRASER